MMKLVAEEAKKMLQIDLYIFYTAGTQNADHLTDLKYDNSLLNIDQHQV